MAEGNGLLNRRMGERPYRGFESRPLRLATLAGFEPQRVWEKYFPMSSG